MRDGKGLCATCANARIVRNRRGSEFVMCMMHVREENYPKYPRLPVLICPGYVELTDDSSGEPANEDC